MRALLLVVLGAGLIWFVWRGLGGSHSGEVEATSAAPGAMIEVETAAETAVDVAPSDPAASTQDPAADPTTAEPTPAAPSAGLIDMSPVAEPTPASRASSSGAAPLETAATPSTSPDPAVPAREGGPASGAELAAAEQILENPAGLEAWLGAQGAGLSGDRREFALGLAHAFAHRSVDALGAVERAGGAVQPSERELVRRIAAGDQDLVPILTDSPMARAASMKELERVAAAHATAGRAREAAEGYSRLLLAEIASPWPADPDRLARWSDSLREAQRGNRWNRRGSWPSREIVVQPGDSLIAIRKRVVAEDPSLVVCTGQIARANQLEGEVIHPGQKLRIPLDRASVLVDLDAHWAFYLTGNEVAAAWPIGVGKESSVTRVGTFTVGKKLEQPMWFPEGRQPVPYGDPENPLGTRWISWDDADGRSTGLGIHGTNEPDSIGKDASLGCIRMRTPDVEELYEVLPRDAVVRVVP